MLFRGHGLVVRRTADIAELALADTTDPHGTALVRVDERLPLVEEEAATLDTDAELADAVHDPLHLLRRRRAGEHAEEAAKSVQHDVHSP